MTYLNRQQVDKLLEPINSARVGKDGKGFSHIEAYEMRAQLTRIYGFNRWSQDVTDQALIFESEKDNRWTVAYRSMVRLTICAPDGTILCTYTEGATGEAKNQPSRGDAHDLALKTSQSQAFKRAAANIGDSGGLSLYNKGSFKPLVYRTLVLPGEQTNDGETVKELDSHVTALAPETPAPQAEPETTPAPAASPGDTPAGQDNTQWVDILRKRVLDEAPGKQRPRAFLAAQLMEAGQKGIAGSLVADADDNYVTLETLIQNAIKAVTA